MNNEEKHHENSATGDPTSCCGPEMDQRMRAFFASLGSGDADESGSCAEWMKEMMKNCFRSSSSEQSTKR